MDRRKKKKGTVHSKAAKNQKVNQKQSSEQIRDSPGKIDIENTNDENPSSNITSYLKPEVLENLTSFNKKEASLKDSKTPISTSKPTDQIETMVEEVAEDMVHLIEWSKQQGKKQEELLQHVHRLQQDIQESKQQHTIEMKKLRGELLGERKALAVRNVLESILPTLDSLRLMKKGLSEKHKQMRSQLDGIISSLENIIQSLGFSKFKVEEGTFFDPSLMECFGYDEGEPETVSTVVQPGYKAGEAIIRPCRVIIAK